MQLVEPVTRLNGHGSRAFSVVGPMHTLTGTLLIPSAVRKASSVRSFKQKLKTSFFFNSIDRTVTFSWLNTGLSKLNRAFE